MKLVLALALPLFFLHFNSKAQSHPTVLAVEVSSKAVDPPTGTVTPISPSGIYVIPSLIVHLQDSVTVTSIRYRMFEVEGTTALFDVVHQLNETVSTDTLGNVLFQNTNGQITISAGQVMGMRAYRHEVTTTDSSLQSTEPFITTE